MCTQPRIAWPSYRFQDVLTHREGEVLDLVSMGRTNAEISAQLGIATATVEVHRLRVMRKLGVRNVAGLVWFALVGSAPPDVYDPTGQIDLVSMLGTGQRKP